MAMQDEEGILIAVGVVAVGIVGYLLLTGSQSSASGVAFGQANPQSVAALYSANAADTAQKTALQTSQSSDLAGIAAGLIGNQQTANNNATTLGTASINADTATKLATLSASSAEYSSAQAAQSQLAGYQAAVAEQGITTAGATDIAGTTAGAQVATAQIQAGQAVDVAKQQTISNLGVAKSATDASIGVANAQTTAAVNAADIAGNTARTTSNNNLFSNIVSTVGGFFTHLF